MRDNIVKDYDGNSLDIYEHRIYVLADDYINTVLNKLENISKKQCFGGMIKYISIHIDKPGINNLVCRIDYGAYIQPSAINITM